MRIALVPLIFSLTACAGAYNTSSDGRLQTKINSSYKERDACLARNVAADGTTNEDAATLARAAALACAGETEKLIDITNRDGDPRVSAAIRRDSEFRAMGYVLRARGQASS